MFKQIETIDDFKIFVDDIIREAIELNASDVHIEPQKEIFQIRYRIDWEIFKFYSISIENKDNLIARIKILAKLKIDESRRPQDWQIEYEYQNNNWNIEDIDMRISTFPTINWEKIVMRILKKDPKLLNINSLWFMQYNLDSIKKTLQNKEWLILISGGTGSGKTTTLYSMLNSYDPEKFNISTLEDPVEYKIAWINQSQVKNDIWYDFSQWLKTLLRQDPDIILVWEIRDRETAKLAIEASMTGHLVFGTIHSNKWVWVIERLVNMWIEPYLIASSLKMVLSQRLVKKVCSKCAQNTEISDEEKKILQTWLWSVWNSIESKIQLKKWEGCKKCLQTWYSWRIGIHELTVIDKDFSRAINKWINNEIWTELCKKKWYLSLYQDALIKSAYWFISLANSAQYNN